MTASTEGLPLGLQWSELVQLITIILGFLGIILTNSYTAMRIRNDTKEARANAVEQAGITRERLKEQAEELRKATLIQADIVRDRLQEQAKITREAVAEAEHRLIEYHRMLVGKIEDNTRLTQSIGDQAECSTQRLSDKADAAYKEANDVNVKLKTIGVKLIDGSLLSQKEH